MGQSSRILSPGRVRSGSIRAGLVVLFFISSFVLQPVHARDIKGSVTAIALAPKSDECAIGRFQTVSIVKSGRRTQADNTLPGAIGSVNSLAYSPDGSLLVAAGGLTGRSGEALVWSLPSRRLVAQLTGPVDVIQSIAWRPGKREVAGASYDRSIYLWRIPSPGAKSQAVAPYRRLLDHTDAVYSVAYSPDGARLASAAGDRTVKIWDADTGKRLITLSESTSELYCVAFRPDGKQVAAAGADRVVRVWNPGTGDLLKSAFAHDGPILRLLYTHNGKSLITCGEDRAVKQWAADSLAETNVFPRQSEWPQSIAVTADDSKIVVGCQDGHITFYPVPDSAGTTKAEPNHNAAVSRSVSGLHLIGLAETAPSADPVVVRAPGNDTPGSAQRVSAPVTITGELWDGRAGASPSPSSSTPASSSTPTAATDSISHYYRFYALRNSRLVLDVMARRAGSPLDSFIQILYPNGAPVEQAVLRAMGQSEITLFDKDSTITGIRLLPFPDLRLNDFVLIGRELLQVGTLPKGPDDDTQFRSIRGQRVGYLGTNPEFHSIGTKVYRVAIHPAGSHFSANGMPLTHLMYENDDGGPLYGRDSCLLFVPPADGDYLVRITDSRSQQGKGFTYKLNIHSPRPDYKISSSPAAVTIPKGGREAVSIECDRYEGFTGSVHVKLEGLPKGFTATECDIEAGENSATLLITAAADAVGSTAQVPVSFRVVSRSTNVMANQVVEHDLEPDPGARKLVIGTPAGVTASTDLGDVHLKPGGQSAIVATIIRSKGFTGRVPLDVRNLPFGVKVMDIGLNGILVNENETTRRIVLACEPWVKPQERPIYLFAGVEGGVGTGAPPLLLHIAP